MDENEKDPLVSAENGSGLISDNRVQKQDPVWNSNKDFQA